MWRIAIVFCALAWLFGCEIEKPDDECTSPPCTDVDDLPVGSLRAHATFGDAELGNCPLVAEGPNTVQTENHETIEVPVGTYRVNFASAKLTPDGYPVHTFGVHQIVARDVTVEVEENEEAVAEVGSAWYFYARWAWCTSRAYAPDGRFLNEYEAPQHGQNSNPDEPGWYVEEGHKLRLSLLGPYTWLELDGLNATLVGEYEDESWIDGPIHVTYGLRDSGGNEYTLFTMRQATIWGSWSDISCEAYEQIN